MGRLRKKFSGNTAEASSEPASSENRTPKSLKPKPKISRNPVIKGTLQAQQKKIKKKKSVLGSKKLSINTDKKDDTDHSVQKSTTGRQNEKKNPANIKIEEKGAGLENKLQSRMNKEKHGGLQKKQRLEKNKEMCSGLEKIEDGQTTEGNNGQVESHPSEKSKEKLDGLQKKRHFDKIKEKSSWFKDIEPSQMNEENHGLMESQQNAEKKEKLSGLQKKLHLDKNKEKSRWFKDIEHGQTTEGNNGQTETQQSEKKKELGGLEKKQQFDKNKEKSRWFKNVEHGQMNEEKHGQLASQRNEKKKEKLGGLIFMCNAKTKPDCFRYSILGLPISKKEVVLGIKPGLKLFLYDFDVKLLYGIYNASSCGGMKLEPAAFGGGFPVQVRFNVHQDCYPLPESVFRRAIKENYNGKNRFDTELTDVQVQTLIELFRPAEVLSRAPPIGPTPIPALHDTKVNEGSRESLVNHHRDSGASGLRTYENGQHLAYVEVPLTEREDLPQNYFPSETEYRTYGLRSDRQNFTPPRSQIAPIWDPHSGHVRQHLLMHPGYLYTDAAPGQLQAAHNDQHLATEKQSLTYGVFPRPELQSSIPLAATTMAYLDPHRPPSGREEVPLGSYSFSGRGETYPSENDRLLRRETYLTQTDHSWRGEAYPTQTTHLGMRQNVDAGMVYSTYASNALSEYNQINKHQGVGPESSLAPVSSRYSFAGPSLTHR